MTSTPLKAASTRAEPGSARGNSKSKTNSRTGVLVSSDVCVDGTGKSFWQLTSNEQKACLLSVFESTDPTDVVVTDRIRTASKVDTQRWNRRAKKCFIEAAVRAEHDIMLGTGHAEDEFSRAHVSYAVRDRLRARLANKAQCQTTAKCQTAPMAPAAGVKESKATCKLAT